MKPTAQTDLGLHMYIWCDCSGKTNTRRKQPLWEANAQNKCRVSFGAGGEI